MILSCQNITKAFGEEAVISNASFHVEDNQKAAIVGINGAGKSTLLKLIIGQLIPDEGEVILSKGKTLGYLAQHQEVSGEASIYEEVLKQKAHLIEMETKMQQMEQQMDTLAAESEELITLVEEYHKLRDEFERQDGYAYRSEVTGIIKGLGFAEDEFDKKMSELSGGQKTRVSLCKLLVSKPDIILLDEPTNHLDIESISWLETFLLNYKGAVIIVSHDRYFLDRVVSKVIEIANHKVSEYDGNYSDYAMKSRMRREAELKQYMNQQAEIKHQQQVIDKLKSFNREKSIKRAESREKALEKVELLEKPVEENTQMRIELHPQIISGNDVLTVEGLAKSFDEQKLFSDISFEIKRGERVALIGANGTGKTTILKIINELLPPDQGTIRLGSNVKIGYYDQEHHVLHSEKTIFDEIADDYPKLTNTEIRNVLAAFLFTNDDVFKKISDLSGGERGRVSLAKLMLSESNFLILDEPTNHLDIMSKEILEHALNSYTGTVFYVSHDRYFINRTATRILNLSAETIVNYIGNYDYYLEKKDILDVKKVDISDAKAEEVPETKTDWAKQKEEAARQRKIANELKKTEEAIEAAENRIREIEEEMSDPKVATNSAALNELSAELDELNAQLEVHYEKWEELAAD